LILLSTVEGLQKEDGSVLTEVKDINDVISHVRDDHGKFSIGGMASKLQAIQAALEGEVETVIASGRKPTVLKTIIEGGEAGTRFLVK